MAEQPTKLRKYLYAMTAFFVNLGTASAVEITVHHPCDANKFLLSSSFLVDADESVGSLSTLEFTKSNLIWTGSAAGIATINGYPSSDRSLEILSDFEMRAYGWCFKVDGALPQSLAHEIPLASVKQRIEWFLAFATYYKGEWKDYCTPTHEAKPEWICKN